MTQDSYSWNVRELPPRDSPMRRRGPQPAATTSRPGSPLPCLRGNLPIAPITLRRGEATYFSVVFLFYLLLNPARRRSGERPVPILVVASEGTHSSDEDGAMPAGRLDPGCKVDETGVPYREFRVDEMARRFFDFWDRVGKWFFASRFVKVSGDCSRHLYEASKYIRAWCVMQARGGSGSSGTMGRRGGSDNSRRHAQQDGFEMV
jgi:hypothetical protein